MSLHPSTSRLSARMRQHSETLLREFRAAESGSIAPLFAILCVLMLLGVGSAVDVGRWLQARTQTQAAIDSAVLAATRHLQVEPDNLAGAIAAAQTYFKSNVGQQIKLINDTVSFSVMDGGRGVMAQGSAYVATPILSLVAIDRLPVVDMAGSNYSAASFSQGSDSRSKIEVAMMLDVTGSMAGHKIADLKTAAKDLVDILVRDGQSNVRVGVAPFSEAVRPGAYLADVRGSAASSVRFQDSNGRWQTYRLSECVAERDGGAAYTDIPPAGTDKFSPVYTRDGTCLPGADIVPLTSNRTTVKSAIDALRSGGYTAGHLGTAWAWYLLSPNWSSVWPGESRPASYSDSNVRKVAILMTDGEYNTEYDAAGVSTRDSGKPPVDGASDVQARRLCESMKTAGIEVYTIGFDMKADGAIATLKGCASTQQQFYLAENGSQLRDAFRDIALKLSPIHLSQ